MNQDNIIKDLKHILGMINHEEIKNKRLKLDYVKNKTEELIEKIESDKKSASIENTII